uniref:Reverse transcriptase domain-containing protein n=1 Tax=Tanacetum cinerariifolium TaxID=118510 RepID=A0A6L2NIC3_TANCI|nr:reverse transcriptase domain-containing protein [Tanacetum cinerariifolium]
MEDNQIKAKRKKEGMNKKTHLKKTNKGRRRAEKNSKRRGNRKNKEGKTIYRGEKENMKRHAVSEADMGRSQPYNESNRTGEHVRVVAAGSKPPDATHRLTSNQRQVPTSADSALSPEPIIPLNKGTSNQNSKSIIEGHVSALKELQKDPSNQELIKPMLLDFDDVQDVSDEKIKDSAKEKEKIGGDDLSKPFKEVLKCPFTRRIVEFSSPGHRLPANAKIYDGTGDPEDHLGRFFRIGNQGEWPMLVWCTMFQQTLDGKARAWFNKLPPGSIDNLGSLQEKFLNRFRILKACDKDPTEITKIVRRANETLPHFKERWVSKSNAIPKVPELMQISSFMSSHKCLELAKCFSDNVPKTVDKMATEHSISYVPPQRPNQEARRPKAVLTLDSLSSTPQEILETEHQPRLPQPAPLVGVPSKENVNKYCGYHNEKGHSTNDYSHLKQQLELALESAQGRSIHHPWHNEIPNPMGVATLVSQIPVVFKCKRKGKKQAVEPSKKRGTQDTISPTNQVLVNPAYPEQLVTIGAGLSPEGANQLKNLLNKNLDIFAWEPSDMNGVPKRIIKHSLNANPLENPVSQKRRVFCSEKSQKSLPFFETLKDITKENKHDYWWTEKVENAFQELNTMILNLTTPLPKETLFVYLASSKELVSAVLLVVRQGKKHPIHYVSKTLHDAEQNYAPLENMALALRLTSRRLRRYFEAHPITVITDQPIKQILSKADTSDGASNARGSGAGLVLISPTKTKCTYALRLNFESTNNQAKYEALLAGLRIAKKIGVQTLFVNVDSKLVASQINGNYEAYVPSMDVEEINAVVEEEGETPTMSLGRFNGSMQHAFKGKIGSGKGHPTRVLLANNAPGRKRRNTQVRLMPDSLPNPQTAQNTDDLNHGPLAILPIGDGCARAIALIPRESKIRNCSCGIFYKVDRSQTTSQNNKKGGEYVYRKNEANRVENLGKLGPKWEGSYLIVEAYQNGSYKLHTMDDREDALHTGERQFSSYIKQYANVDKLLCDSDSSRFSNTYRLGRSQCLQR